MSSLFAEPPLELLDKFLRARNAAAIYADLHEAVRRRQIMHVVGEREVLGAPPGLDLMRPVYDMDHIMRTWACDGVEATQEHYTRGIALAREGSFVPGPIALMRAYSEAWPNYRTTCWVEQVILIDPAPPGVGDRDDCSLCYFFERTVDMFNGAVATIGPVYSDWISRRTAVLSPGWVCEDQINQFARIEDSSLHPDDKALITQHQASVYTMVGALAQPPTLAEVSDPHFSAMNAGRARGRLAPIPQVQRVLHLHRTIYPSSSGPHEPTGREMPTHYRRTHQREYRSERYINMRGQRGPVRATIIRSDKGTLTMPPIYEVDT